MQVAPGGFSGPTCDDAIGFNAVEGVHQEVFRILASGAVHDTPRAQTSTLRESDTQLDEQIFLLA